MINDMTNNIVSSASLKHILILSSFCTTVP